MIRVETCTSIHQTKPETWDAFANKNWFHKHRFVASVEEGHLPGAQYWYLLFHKDDQLIGNCALSTFDISLDLFASNNRFYSFIKRLFPETFQIKILMCGLPASFGQKNLHFIEPRFAEEIVDMTVATLHKIAKQRKINYLCFKEFTNQDEILWNSFERHHFFAANSIPYMKLDVRWSAFSEYLNALRHSYRRSIKQSLRKIGLEEPVIYDASSGLPDSNDFPVLIVGDRSLCPPEQFYRMYRAVMTRAPTKLEVLTPEFFHSLYENMGEDLKLFILKKDETIFSAALLLQNEHSLTFMLAGRENQCDEYDSYFNLVSGILAMAIKNGIREIKLGQTAYWVKQRIGGMAEDEYFFFHARKPILHALLKKFNRIIFPAVKLPRINVFKNETMDAINRAPF